MHYSEIDISESINQFFMHKIPQALILNEVTWRTERVRLNKQRFG